MLGGRSYAAPEELKEKARGKASAALRIVCVTAFAAPRYMPQARATPARCRIHARLLVETNVMLS